MINKSFSLNKYQFLVFILLLGFMVIRIWYLFVSGASIDSDEAIVGLMGRHILQGEHVTFFYGQEYMGSLEAYVAAVAFYLFGSSSWALKLVPFFFSLLFFILSVCFARLLYGRLTSILTAFLLVFSSPFFLVWSLKARGGYMETLFFGTALIMLAYNLLLHVGSCQKDVVKKKCGLLRTLFNFLLIFVGLIISLQLVKGGVSLEIGEVSISSRGFVRPVSAFLVFWLFGYVLCKGEPIQLSKLVTPYWKNMALFGFVAGLSWWTNQLILFYLLPIILVLIWLLRSSVRDGNTQFYFLVTFVAMFFIGSLPYWLYVLFEGLSGTSVTGLATIDNWVPQGIGFFKVALPRLLGLSFHFADHPLIAGSTIFVGISYMIALFALVKKTGSYVLTGGNLQPRKGVEVIFILFLLFYPFLFSVSSMGWYASEPRYLLPLFSVLPIVAASFLSQVFNRSKSIFALFVMSFVLLSFIQIFTINLTILQPWVKSVRLPNDFSPLIGFLQKKNIKYVYADYWISYRLTFESNEKIICSLYPPGVNDRYPPYTKLLEKSDSPTYIIMRTVSSAFEFYLKEMNIRDYHKKELPPFVIYYDVNIDQSVAEEQNNLISMLNIVPLNRTGNIQLAIDGDFNTRWQSKYESTEAPFFQIELDAITPIDHLDLIMGRYTKEMPSSLKIETSLKGKEWKKVQVVENLGQKNLLFRQVTHPIGPWHGCLSFDLGGQRARFVRLSSLKNDTSWSIAEIEMYR